MNNSESVNQKKTSEEAASSFNKPLFASSVNWAITQALQVNRAKMFVTNEHKAPFLPTQTVKLITSYFVVWFVLLNILQAKRKIERGIDK